MDGKRIINWMSHNPAIKIYNDLWFVCELFWINFKWLVLVKYSLKVLLFLKVYEYKYEYRYYSKVGVLSTDEYCKIGTRVPKYWNTENFDPKPDIYIHSMHYDYRNMWKEI